MGVQGLWHLLQPCARPTKLESLEGKRLAIDSSIWLYHFQMAMRDKEGRTLSNAHILGFLWRILKLIHFGIRPIFVFDGGAPVLKRKTLSGRKTRKAGARDDHRRVAERLLHARMREAAVAHVTGTAGQASAEDEGGEGEPSEGHGLGDNTVYMEDLAGTTGASAAVQQVENAADDGAITVGTIREREKEAEAARKKKRDQWQKDPYALPALDKEISTITAENSSRARKGKGGGRRPDVRFATEGELRSLLSSIQPTDLDLDSEFFRSLPAELQYELVGDLRAASRGTSYKRLQSMLAQSPTPIDFSRAQIAGLKTRNELTQKALEVTDEIGDAHIKVPIRVAGARNREYVLVRNKGDQAGFVLGVREAGNTEEKAIAVDEDTASASTFEDDLERRNTEDEFDLEEVSVQDSPVKAAEIPAELQSVNPNDPMARKKVARELLQRRARELAKERAKESGNIDEHEMLEEQLEKVRQAHRRTSGLGRRRGRGRGGAPDALFRRLAEAASAEIDIERIGQEDLIDTSDSEALESDAEGSDTPTPQAEVISDDEAEDLTRALDESEAASKDTPAAISVDGEDADDEVELEMDEVDTSALDANDYAAFYTNGDKKPTTQAGPSRLEETVPIKKGRKRAAATKEPKKKAAPRVTKAKPQPEPVSSRSIKSSSGLGFRLSDREGYPERLDPKLRTKMRWNESDEAEGASATAAKQQSPDKPIANASAAAPMTPQGSPVGKRIAESDLDSVRKPSITSEFSEPLQQANSEEEGAKDDVRAIKQEPPSPPAVRETVRDERDLQDATGDQIHVVDFQDQKAQSPDERQLTPTSTGTKSRVLSRLDSPNAPAPAPSIATPRLLDVIDESVAAAQSNQKAEERQKLPRSPRLTKSDSRGKQASASPSRSAPHKAKPPSVHSEEEDAEAARALAEISENPAVQAAADPNMQPEFDNFGSMVDEAGEYPGTDRDLSHEDPSRREREQSQYSEDWPDLDELPSRSPSPDRGVVLGPDGFPLPTAEELDAMQAEDEADLGHIEGDQDEFVSFLSRAKGRGLREVRQEVEDEVNQLRVEHAATRRAEGDITIQMAKEIQLMLRLFGLPYITAPMEAEAQCAELVSIGLADGIITDDSDVFLFGGTFVYKNMFNNKKYVECYKLSDLNHDLGMDRSKLVQLAYLLGSDYTDGLEGVGPVLAMEILGNFPGDDGLIKFRDWWMKVQTGNDTPRDTHNATLKRLKRTLRNKVHFDTHWPDGNVLNAYYEPTVDNSEEPFQWGLPDLDSLRSFFHEYLRWDREKTDHYLLPAIEEQNRRHRRTQATLDSGNFFDLGGGQVAAGRARPGYNSSRLQQVISNFRKGKAASTRVHDAGGKDQEPVHLSDSGEGEEVEEGVPEQLLGKEMGKRSRPIVAPPVPVAIMEEQQGQNGDQPADDTIESEQPEIGNKRKKAANSRATRGAKRARGRGAARGGASIRGRGKTKPTTDDAQADPEARQVQDEEWRPRAPRARRNVQRSDSGTSLTQGRRMNLDSIDALVPPSRAAMLRRDGSSSSLSSSMPPRDDRSQSRGIATAEATPIELSDDSGASE